MTCQQCGHAVPAGAGFCPACGCRVAAATAPSGTTPSGTAPDETQLATPSGAAPGETPPGTTPVSTTLAPGSAFGPRYRILHLLGAGGMGVVYQAWDEELGLSVALKLIRPEILADPATGREMERRFKRELLLARQVTHKHVVRIHDMGEVGGVKYFTMPFVAGSSLARTIAEQGRLPVAQALRIARQVASGLEAAHEAGVVHRDLKPENVMIDADGSAVIMDFGIARSAEGSTATVQGAVVGTLGYMAPEQAEGRTVDHRVDIYAAGLLLYDMLSGRRRFGRYESAMSEMLARMHAAPQRLRELEPRVPEALDAVVGRCLEPDPARRFQTTREFIAALDGLDAEGHARAATTPTDVVVPAARPAAPSRRRLWTAAAGVLLLAAVAVAWWAMRAPTTVVAPAEMRRDSVSVLVADFTNETGDAVFDGSLEQPMSIGIEGASFIVSYPRREAERAARAIRPDAVMNEETARLVSQREGIKVVLSGSIRMEGTGYRIGVRIVDPVPGTVLATLEASAATKADVLGAVGTLASKARSALGDTATETGRATANETFTAASLEAARDYAQAQTLAGANKDAEAIALYRKALDQDPNLGRAYAGWAASAIKLGRRAEGDQAYEKALALVDRMTEREKYRTLGAYYLNVAGNYDKAIESFEALVSKYPADGAAHNNLAIAYFGTLDFARAVDQGRRLLEIYPASVLYRSNYSLYAMYAGDFDTAAAEGRKVAESGDFLAYLPIAMAAVAAGRLEEAAKAYEEARATGALGESLASLGLADLAMYSGRYGEAVPVLQRGTAADLQGQNEIGAAAKEIALAEALVAVGDTSGAVAAIGRARTLSHDASVAVPAAGLFVSMKRLAEAESIARALDNELQPRSRAYAALIRGRLALARGRPPEAVTALGEARKQADLWLVRYWLGVAFVEAGANAEALSELDSCVKRRGEATAIFLDDLPTFRYFPPVHYWLGRAHEGLAARDAAARSYRAYLDIRPAATGDALAQDARRRAAALP